MRLLVSRKIEQVERHGLPSGRVARCLGIGQKPHEARRRSPDRTDHVGGLRLLAGDEKRPAGGRLGELELELDEMGVACVEELHRAEAVGVVGADDRGGQHEVTVAGRSPAESFTAQHQHLVGTLGYPVEALRGMIDGNLDDDRRVIIDREAQRRDVFGVSLAYDPGPVQLAPEMGQVRDHLRVVVIREKDADDLVPVVLAVQERVSGGGGIRGEQEGREESEGCSFPAARLQGQHAGSSGSGTRSDRHSTSHARQMRGETPPSARACRASSRLCTSQPPDACAGQKSTSESSE